MIPQSVLDRVRECREQVRQLLAEGTAVGKSTVFQAPGGYAVEVYNDPSLLWRIVKPEELFEEPLNANFGAGNTPETPTVSFTGPPGDGSMVYWLNTKYLRQLDPSGEPAVPAKRFIDLAVYVDRLAGTLTDSLRRIEALEIEVRRLQQCLPVKLPDDDGGIEL